MGHGYEQGRLDLPFAGFCTFAKRPICTDWDNIDADVAILGIPYDMGTQYRSVRARSVRPRRFFLLVIPVPTTMKTASSIFRATK